MTNQEKVAGTFLPSPFGFPFSFSELTSVQNEASPLRFASSLENGEEGPQEQFC